MSAPSKVGVLLVNLGTPDAPETAEVRRYLAEFLADPRVIDINPVARWALLHLIILRTRPAKSAEAYRAIWREDGSPLLVFSQHLLEKIRERIGDRMEVALAMRYGNPSIRAGLTELRDKACDKLIVFPLYPHYASSSTGSTLEAVYRQASELWNTPYISVVPAFYDHPAFIKAFEAVGREVLDRMKPDHVLLSFHGLPERHMLKSDETGRHCLQSETCCDQMVEANRNCYRAQCFATARALTAALGLGDDQYTVSFQSRLGRTPWVKPYTDELLPVLAKDGTKKLAVFCPAFVADCLETLEEIGIRALEDFTAAGGDALELVPSLNARSEWVDAVVQMIEETAGTP